MCLKRVSDPFGADTHDELDRQVEKAVEDELDDIPVLTSSHQYATVLNAIIEHSDGKLATEYLKLGRARMLVKTHGELCVMLADALKCKSYREIRRLEILCPSDGVAATSIGPYLDDLNRFVRTVWGNPQALRRRLPPHGVEFIDLGEYYTVFLLVFTGLLKHDKILVREEYRTALQALQTWEYRRGAYVTGQPGIGKTYFLIYALVHFLGEKQPVALQPVIDTGIYLLFKDDVAAYPITAGAPLLQCDSLVWALSDSGAHVKIPPPVFLCDADRIRVVQTTSPKASRYKEWSKQYGASCYVMDIWTEEEIGNLATLLELDVGHMITLARKWGAVPRTLLEYFGNAREDQQFDSSYRGLITKAIEKSQTMMNQGLELNLSADLDLPSPFYFIRPRKGATGDLYRDFVDITVPTRTLRELLGEGLRSLNNQVKLDFYTALSQCPETCQAAGCIFESWFHGFLIAGKEMQCQWIAQGSDNDIAQLPTMIRGTKNFIPATWEALKTETLPYYWLPPRTNFPGIDSILVLEKQIIAFQVTISASHRSPIEGLKNLRKRLPTSLKKGIHWSMVFVGPQESSIKAVAERWAASGTGVYFPTRETCMPIAWSQVDPVRNDFPYKAYRDVADLVLEESNEEMEVDQARDS